MLRPCCVWLILLVAPTRWSVVYGGSGGHHYRDKDKAKCPCQILPRPDLDLKAETARWMVHTLDWGVLSTISSKYENAVTPFGNVYSFVDGPCNNPTGTPYLYGTYMDQSFQDTKIYNKVSLTLSEASLSTVCGAEGLEACPSSSGSGGGSGTGGGDAENPVCARLTLTGVLVDVPNGSDEFHELKKAFFQRHSQMSQWPQDHEWVIAKLDIQYVWLIDYFGGASHIGVDKYYAAQIQPAAEGDNDDG